MLVAGAITSIVAYLKNYTLVHFLWVLVASLIIFYVMGRMITKVFDRFEQENKEAEELENAEEGAVIEKDVAPEETDDTQEPS